MTSENIETFRWRECPSIQKSDSTSLSTRSTSTSHHPSLYPLPFAPPINADSSPQSKLEIRTRSITPLSLPSFRRPQATNSQASQLETQSFSPSTIRKRQFNEIIDLTIDDDDDDFESSKLHERKKSRSSSHSDEARTKQPGIIKNPTLTSGKKVPSLHLKFHNSGKNTDLHSSTSEVSSAKPATAVIVPPLQPSPSECRRIFIKNLSVLKKVSVVNKVDDTSPPLDFQFIAENILGDDVQQVSEDFMNGCKCRKDNGRNIGCEYLSCECLDDLVVSGGKKQFPYSQAKFSRACLRDAFIAGRNHIYECNKRCNCNNNCKNRVVQHGRNVGLEIFKTDNGRGWGLRCTEDLKKGQFIDTYRGEIITHDEANRRGEARTTNKNIYLMSLDKFTEEDGGSKYVCDGMHFGGPTRFINHSCDPNCAIYTVSYNHADNNIYDLAFFATETIEAGTELTFNYVDDDRTDVITKEQADEMQRENGYRPAICLCGSVRCRGYFFT